MLNVINTPSGVFELVHEHRRTDGRTDERTKRVQVTQCKTRRINKRRRINKVEHTINVGRRDGNSKKEIITVTGYEIAFVLAARES